MNKIVIEENVCVQNDNATYGIAILSIIAILRRTVLEENANFMKQTKI